MSESATQIFVYYRVRAADVPLAIATVRAAFVDLKAALPGLVCSLSQRADEVGELRTLMETYAHAAGVSSDTRRTIEDRLQSALVAWIVGERHAEAFVPCA